MTSPEDAEARRAFEEVLVCADDLLGGLGPHSEWSAAECDLEAASNAARRALEGNK